MTDLATWYHDIAVFLLVLQCLALALLIVFLYYRSLGFLSTVRPMFAELGSSLHRQNSLRTVAEKRFCEV